MDSKGIAFTIRSVFIIDPKKTIRLILSYPASTGRNTAEVLRVVDSLQTGDKQRITTPINWLPGDDVIVHPSVNSDLAKVKSESESSSHPFLLTLGFAGPFPRAPRREAISSFHTSAEGEDFSCGMRGRSSLSSLSR